MAGVDPSKIKKPVLGNNLVANPTYSPDTAVSLGRGGNVPNDNYAPDKYVPVSTLDTLNNLNKLPDATQRNQGAGANQGAASTAAQVANPTGANAPSGDSLSVIGSGNTGNQFYKAVTTPGGGSGYISMNKESLGKFMVNDSGASPSGMTLDPTRTYGDAMRDIGTGRGSLSFMGDAGIGADIKAAQHAKEMALLRAGSFDSFSNPMGTAANIKSPYEYSGEGGGRWNSNAGRTGASVAARMIRDGAPRWQVNATLNAMENDSKASLGQQELGLKGQELNYRYGPDMSPADRLSMLKLERDLAKDAFDARYKQATFDETRAYHEASLANADERNSLARTKQTETAANNRLSKFGELYDFANKLYGTDNQMDPMTKRRTLLGRATQTFGNPAQANEFLYLADNDFRNYVDIYSSAASNDTQKQEAAKQLRGLGVDENWLVQRSRLAQK